MVYRIFKKKNESNILYKRSKISKAFMSQNAKGER